VLDAVAVAIFTIEYFARIYSCVEGPGNAGAFWGRFRYGRSPLAIIDFLAIVPFYLEALLHHLFDLRFLRVFRLMRLLKLTRQSQATGTLLKALKREWPVIAASTFIMLLMVVLTASLGYLFEHEAQPDKFENIPQSIYWAVVTLASVGYGDISPITPVGRLMTIIMALVGIGIFAVPAAILSTAFNDQLHKEREAMRAELYVYMEDGVIDDDEMAKIQEVAKGLHISQDEIDTLIEKAKQQLHQRGQAFNPYIQVGAMIEIPAAALVLPLFINRFDFLSIGTNDLIQYTLAIDRADHAVAHLYDPLHPAILHLLANIIEQAKRANIPIAVCGEMAGDPSLTRLVLGMGLTDFSMHFSQLLLVKREILKANVGLLKSRVPRVLKAYEPDEQAKALERLMT
jgi:voltage-gated potassium channel Kch